MIKLHLSTQYFLYLLDKQLCELKITCQLSNGEIYHKNGYVYSRL